MKRKNDFEKFKSEMQQKGYKMKNIIINTQQAKPLCLLIMLPFMALAFGIYYKVNGFDLDCLSWGFLVALLILILCLSILHELIHGITWSLSETRPSQPSVASLAWQSVMAGVKRRQRASRAAMRLSLEMLKFRGLTS